MTNGWRQGKGGGKEGEWAENGLPAPNFLTLEEATYKVVGQEQTCSPFQTRSDAEQTHRQLLASAGKPCTAIPQNSVQLIRAHSDLKEFKWFSTTPFNNLKSLT